MNPAAGVGADQYLPLLPGGQLAEGELRRLDVVRGGDGAGVARAEHDGQRLPGPVRPMVGQLAAVRSAVLQVVRRGRSHPQPDGRG
jgi:hypothetical protein